MSAPVDFHISELYFEYYEIHVYLHGRKAPAYLSAENKIVFSQSDANWFETAMEAYRKIRHLPKGMGLFVVERIIEYPVYTRAPNRCPDFLKKILDNIPSPHSHTAAAWYWGADLKNGLVPWGTISKSTYYRHRKKLIEYGIDISEKCNVHILRIKKNPARQS